LEKHSVLRLTMPGPAAEKKCVYEKKSGRSGIASASIAHLIRESSIFDSRISFAENAFSCR
jgi:hypothetical protein